MNVPKETRISDDQRKFEKKQWQEKAPKVHINTKTKKYQRSIQVPKGNKDKQRSI